MGVLALVGAAVLAVMLVVSPPWGGFGASAAVVWMLIGALCLGELRPIPISRGAAEVGDNLTVSTTFAVVLLVVTPVSLVMVVQVAAVFVDDLRVGRPWRKRLFNAGQYVVSLLVAAVVLRLSGGPPVTSSGASFTVDLVVPSLLAGAALVITNHVLVAVAVALDLGEPFREVLAADARFSTAISALLISLAPVVGLIGERGALLLLLLLLPMVALHFGAAQAMERERQALHDSLTGLGNREFLQVRGRLAFGPAPARGDRGPAVLSVGIDRFADIVDSLGHPVADAVLQEVARRLEREVEHGGGSALSRVGDEFAVLVPQGRAAAERLGAQLLAALAAPVEVRGARLLLSAGVGLAAAPDDARDVDALLQCATVALHDPERPLDRPHAYCPQIESGRRERLALLSDLREAVDEGQFALEYQPQVDVRTGAVVGAEALVRWHHPVRGLVPPDAFIGLAESTGLIAQITALVLDQALAAAARWRAAGHAVRVAVNVSARQFSDTALPERVAAALHRHAVPPQDLALEVTETGILGEPVNAGAIVRKLREQGVSIAVDDYGTGQASLSYLKRLDIDELKIDKVFVLDMGSDSGDRIIVRSTIELGHDLGLRIVAEGVEDAETLALLADLGCDVAQGWHTGRPVPEAGLLALLRGAPGTGPSA